MGMLKAGERFNKLVVLNETDKRLNHSILYECKCDCGNIVFTTSTRLKKGYIKSCGCLQRTRASEANKTHGQSRTKLYYVYRDMKSRCNNEKHHAYQYYGGRGIKVCEDWDKSFLNFYNWALISGYTEGLTLDRINNNGNYTPINCRWVTMAIQSNNRRQPKDKKIKTQPVNMYSLTGEFIRTYNSIKEACIDNHIKGTGTCISACCRGRQKTAYNHKWKYYNDNYRE